MVMLRPLEDFWTATKLRYFEIDINSFICVSDRGGTENFKV